MPASSVAQRKLFAIAEHHPDKLHKENKHMLGDMSKSQMHDYAATPEKGLPEHTKKDKAAKLKAIRGI